MNNNKTILAAYGLGTVLIYSIAEIYTGSKYLFLSAFLAGIIGTRSGKISASKNAKIITAATLTLLSLLIGHIIAFLIIFDALLKGHNSTWGSFLNEKGMYKIINGIIISHNWISTSVDIAVSVITANMEHGKFVSGTGKSNEIKLIKKLPNA